MSIRWQSTRKLPGPTVYQPTSSALGVAVTGAQPDSSPRTIAACEGVAGLPNRVSVRCGPQLGTSWIEWVARLPLGVENYQRTTLTETPGGGTLVRFN